MSSTVHRILSIPAKLVASVIIVVPVFAPLKARILRNWYVAKRQGLANHFFLAFKWAFFRFDYLRREDPEQRARLSALAMSGVRGAGWADAYGQRPLVFDDKHPLNTEFNGYLSSLPAGTLVIQIGSSSGREAAHFAAANSRLTFLGLDIDAAIIQYCEEKYSLQNLSFAVCRAEAIETKLPPKIQPFVVFASSCLQYLQPEHARQFFMKMADYKAAVFVQDAITYTDAELFGADGSKFIGDFCFNHDHARYADAAGLRILDHRFGPASDDHRAGSAPGFYYLAACAREFPVPPAWNGLSGARAGTTSQAAG